MEEAGKEYQKVQEASLYLKQKMPFVPKAGIILGTGLGGFTNSLNIVSEIHTAEVPHLIPPKVISHKGRLIFSEINKVPIVILSGRVHYYEGHDMNAVVRPIRLMHDIGCTHLIITNAAGGINPGYEAGDVVIIRDHINLMSINPLRGPNEERWGPRFPDMMHAYDRKWITYALDAIKSSSMKVMTGVYAGHSGPSMETPAEYEYLHRMGADLVGMSAVPEAIAAHHIGLKILGISVVSNICYPPERTVETTVEEVIRTVEMSVSNVSKIIHESIAYCKE